MKVEPIKLFRIGPTTPITYVHDTSLVQSVERIEAKAVERAAMDLDNAICKACIEAAREAGITELVLVDKQFVADAIREKLERMKEDETAESEEAMP